MVPFRTAFFRQIPVPIPSLASLNDAQRAAATHVEGPLLVLAGPGSGKTRVVTHRVAHLIAEGVPAREIVALTFTNKAADEMRRRVAELVGPQPVEMGTFHALCARILRRDGAAIGLSPRFVIYDTDDQQSLMKQAFRDLMAASGAKFDWETGRVRISASFAGSREASSFWRALTST